MIYSLSKIRKGDLSRGAFGLSEVLWRVENLTRKELDEIVDAYEPLSVHVNGLSWLLDEEVEDGLVELLAVPIRHS